MKGIIDFFKGTVKEMKLISWPTKETVWENTKIVIALSFVLVVFLFFSDQIVNWFVGLML